MSYSIILPTLNEKGNIIDLIETIRDIFIKNKLIYEIIVVDDNSNDGTIEIVENFIKKNSFIKLYIRKNKNSLPESLNDGIKLSSNEYIIWMDADFQHPPKYIQEFINLSNKNDVIVCSRFLSESKRYFYTNKLNKDINENQSLFYNTLCKKFIFNDVTDYTSGYICLNKKVLNGYRLKGYYGDYFLNLIFHIKKKNYILTEIPFSDNLRKTGLSKTLINLNFKYLYTCFRYLITFFSVMIKALCIKIKF